MGLKIFFTAQNLISTLLYNLCTKKDLKIEIRDHLEM